MKCIQRFFLSIMILTLVACSTPRAAMDQANHATALVSQLELALVDFRRAWVASEKSQLASQEDQMEAIRAVKSYAGLDSRARKAAGEAGTALLIDKIIAESEGVASIDISNMEAKAQDDKSLSVLLAPVLATNVATSDTQKKLAELGEELSSRQRFSELADFIKAIKENIDSNKKKMEEAEANSR